MTQSLKGIKANAIVSATSSITTSTSVGGNLLPTGNVTYDIGSSTARWKDLYLSNNTIFLGNTAVSANSILPINLDIAPEVLTIQVAAPDSGDDTTWFWTWETSTLPYARTSITNSPQLNVPLYKQGTYTLNNFAGATAYGNMTQTHAGHFKWIDGAGTQNLVSWAVKNANPVSVTHASINGGVATNVERTVITVPSTITLPTLVQPSGISYNVSFVSAGSYTISGDAEGNNKSIGPLYRGSTYTFNLAASLANHPFYITTDNGTGFVANTYVGEYTNGVVGSRNNGSSGQTTLVFTVPNNAPDTLYYQCGVHSSMRGAIVIKDLAVETNINGNYVIYFQHTHEGHKTPIEIRPIPSLVNQMCVVYDASVGKFVPQDLATYVENTPSFKNKIREVAGTATLIAPNGVAVVPTVLVVEDVGYLPLINNKNGDIAFDSYTDTMYVWETNAWRSTKPSSLSLSTGNISITGGTANYFLKTDGSGNLSWDSPSTTPKISSITYPGDDTAAIPAGGQTITLTGSGFNSGASVLINGTYASVVTVVSSTSITFTAPAMAAGTYTLYLINTDGGTSISVPGISYSGTPIWSTSAGSLGTSYETNAISSSLAATGDNPVTYSLYSGTLPPGSSLNSSTGLISGTSQSTASSTTYSFTIRATDAQNQDTDRAFSLTINPDTVSWSTPADNSTTTAYEYATITPITLSATSTAGKSITYTANSLPTGITLSGSSISGTPTTVGSTSTLLTGTAATTNKTATRTVNFVVNQDVVTWSTPADNTTYNLSTNEVMSNVAMSASSAAGKSITYTANALPTGLSITGANIAGTPTISGNSSSLVTATASTTNRTATRTINWVVSVANDTYFKNVTLLLNGETTVTPFISDSSTNSFGLTINGDTKPVLFNPYTPGYYSNYFSGSTDYLTLPSSSTAYNFGVNVDFTIEAWVYPTVLQGFSWGIIDARVNGATAAAWLLQLVPSSGTYRLEFYNAAANTGTTIIPLNTWTHVAASRVGSNLYLYVNGTLDRTITSYNGTISPGTTAPRVGTSKDASGTNYATTGYISNLRIVNGTGLYSSNFTPSTTPLTAIANTSLLTCQSNRFIDNSTNNFTITKVGNTAVSSAIPFTPNSSYSTYGSTYFNGTDSYITAPLTPYNFAPAGDFTIEAWVYLTGALASGNYTISSNWPAGSVAAQGFQFQVNTSGYLLFVAGIGGTQVQVTGTSQLVSINAWNHVAVSRSGATIRLFVNGVQDSTTGNNSGALNVQNPPYRLAIGCRNDSGGYYFGWKGYITDYHFVGGTAVYTTTFTPPTSPLTAIANTSLLTLKYNGGANNSGIIDNSPFNNIITRNGNSTQGSFSPYSVTGYSTYYNGTTDYQTLATNAAYAIGTANFTVEMWVMPTGANLVWSTLFAGVNYGASSDWGLYASDSTTPLYPIFYFTSSGTPGNGATQTQGSQTLTGYTKLTIGQWNHIAVSRVSGTARMFLNGTQTGPSVNASTWSLTNTLQKAIAGGYNGNTNTLFTGYISNLRVISGTGLYTTTFTPSTTPLTPVTGTILLTNQSNRFIDNGPNNFALTNGGTPSIQAYSPFGSVPEAVPISYSVYFDGTGDYLTGPANNSTTVNANTPFTIEVWAYFNNFTLTTQNPNLFTFPGGAAPVQLYSSTGGVIGFWDGTSNQVTGTVVQNTWNHIAVARNSSGSIAMWINGTRTSTNTGYTVAFGSSSGSFYIATFQGAGGYINGYISNLRIVNGTEVYATSQTTITVPTSPLTAIANTSLLTCQSTRMIDNSTNNFTLTANGDTKPRIFNPFGYTAQSATSYTPSIHGGSVYFDGTGDYLTMSPGVIIGSSAFTVELWAYYDGTPWTTSPYIPSFLRSNNNNALQFGLDSGTAVRIVVDCKNVSSTYFTIPAMVPYQWNHIVLVRNTANQMTVFVNGVRSSTGVSSISTNYSGITDQIVGSTTPLFKGYMADLKITKGAALYDPNANGFVPPVAPTTPTADTTLLLNGTSGGIIDYHGTNDLETVGNTQLSTAVKKYNNASMYFDGTGDSLKTSPGVINSLGSGDFTIEGWVYPSSLSSMRILSQGTYATGEFLFILNSNGSADFCEATTSRVTFSAGSFVVGEWKHFAIVRSGSGSNNLKGYINGTLAGTGTSSSYNYSATTAIFVGSNPTTASQDFQGYIDDLRITKGYARYTANFTPPTALITK